MNNYKIKVNDEAESKEAQELFFELGYQWCKEDKGVFWETISGFIFASGRTKLLMSGVLINADTYMSITLHQLRDMVAQSKPTEQGLISGADAKLAWAKGENVQISFDKKEWKDIVSNDRLLQFEQPCGFYRIKPRTVKIELEIPAPFEPKDGDMYWHISPEYMSGYASSMYNDGNVDTWQQFGAWRTEEEIKQVVAALRGIKG